MLLIYLYHIIVIFINLNKKIIKQLSDINILLINIRVFRRIIHLPDNSLSCTNENLFVKNNVPINGKLDLDVKQGSKTPDCDLLALLLSMKEKPEGKKYLESLLTYDKDSNQLSVNLAGVNKSYTFTQEEISKYDSLSTGDGDIRAIELALAKHIYDSDKSEKKTEFNPSKILNGLFAHQSFNLLKGERPISKYETTDNLVDDFGNPNKFFQLSFYKQTEHMNKYFFQLTGYEV